MIQSLNVLRDPQVMFGVIGLTVFLRLVEAGAYWLVLSSFGIIGGYWMAVLVVCVVSLAGAISASPGQIGVTHFAIVLVLTTLEIERDVALAFAIIAHMLMFVPITVVGAVVLARQGLSLRHFGSAHVTQTQAMRQGIEYVVRHKGKLNPYIRTDVPKPPTKPTNSKPPIKPGDVPS